MILTGLVIRNLPKEIPESEIFVLLDNHGLPPETDHNNVKIIKNKRNTRVDIVELTSENCNLLIENLHELDLYENKIYCKGMLLVDPKNTNCAEEVVIVNVDAENSSASKESISPSLSPIRNIPGFSD